MGAPGSADIIDLTNDISDVEEIPADQARRSTSAKELKLQKKRKASAVLEEGEIFSSGASRAASPRRPAERGRAQSSEGAGREPTEESSKKRRKKKTKSAPSSSRGSPQPQEKQSVSDAQNPDNSSLFFVDVIPAQVAEDLAFHEPPPAPHTIAFSFSADVSSSSPKMPPLLALLLPAHVSIVVTPDGAPVEAIRPPSPGSDLESYIDYLDYDDHTVCIRSRIFISAH
jgi:hypothetical protein